MGIWAGVRAALAIGLLVTQLSCHPADSNAIVSGFPNDLTPSWSSDGKTIYFQSDRAIPLEERAGQTHLFRIPVDGGTPERLGTPLNGIWEVNSGTADGSVVLSAEAGPVAVSPATGEQRPIDMQGRTARELVPTRDGRWLYCIVDREDSRSSSIWRRPLAPSGTVRFTLITRVEGRAVALAPSPDGKLLAFGRESVDSREEADILVGSPETQEFQARYRCPRRIGRLSWFPDGKRLLVEQAAYDPASDTTHRVIALNGKGGIPLRFPPDHPIHHGSHTMLSPKGRRIVFTANLKADEGYFLYTCDLDGRQLRQLTHPPVE